VLCVQRTGWGKSMVYFLAAKLFRDQGRGVTVIISPLLALMRNQIDAAKRLGVNAQTINSTNVPQWPEVTTELLAGQVDLLLISPERLANDKFVTGTLQHIAASIPLLVVDEAHCISDWGHDFRPDYRRLGRLLELLPGNIAVLATTATANNRVTQDVSNQMSGNETRPDYQVDIQRGPLMRESLSLQNIHLLSDADRLAWLADHIPTLPGSGIVYALTQRDTERVSKWLQLNGVDAHAYHSDIPHPVRLDLEDKLLANQVKCLVATTALGMGYDKADLPFVIHYQTPGSVVGYYQQVGRAGRAIPSAFGVVLPLPQDGAIHQFFRNTAFPPESQIIDILNALQAAQDGLTMGGIESAVNLGHSKIEKVLKLLVVEPQSPVIKLDYKEAKKRNSKADTWYRTLNAYQLDKERIAHLTRQREYEWEEMQTYLSNQCCLMQFLAEALDDDAAKPCGRCAVCLAKEILPSTVEPQTLAAAQKFVKQSEMPLDLNKQWDISALPRYQKQFGWKNQNIPAQVRGEVGRVLSRWGEPVWGELVEQGKSLGYFDDELVTEAVDMVRNRWPRPDQFDWVTCIPSQRHHRLVPEFAQRLADALGVPFKPVVQQVRATEPQKGMENRFHRCQNLDGALAIQSDTKISGMVLLVDDIVDSGWTMTIAATLLREAGAAAVYPFALATTSVK
jgi:ATP-dependent DNA helicase RecQ